MSSATARVAPDLLKALAVLSDTTVKDLAHSSLEPPLEYNQDQLPLTNQDSL